MPIEKTKANPGASVPPNVAGRVTSCAPLVVSELVEITTQAAESGAHGVTRPATAGCIRAKAVFLLALLCALAGLAVAADQKPAASTVRGFQAPLEYYEAPHELQVKSFLEGAEAEPGADGVIQIRNAKLQTFREDGTKDMTVKAPQCVFDTREHTVSSAGPLQVQTTNVLVEGVGFLWQQTNSVLFISNQQVTTVTGQMTNTFSP